MSENLLQTLQHLIQDVIAPDVRELKVRVSSLEKQMDIRFDAVDSRFAGVNARFDAFEKQINARFEALESRLKSQDVQAQARFEALLAAISDSKSQAELAAFRALAPVSERVAVLESSVNRLRCYSTRLNLYPPAPSAPSNSSTCSRPRVSSVISIAVSPRFTP